jgi:hypothetical protein
MFPLLSRSEVLVLKDGSSLNGRLVALRGDTLVFKTSFGAVVKVPKERILRLEFASGAKSEKPPTADQTPATLSSSAPGTLRVDCSKISLSSRITVHRREDLTGHMRANSIEQMLLVSGTRAYSYIDSITDKRVREGPDEMLKNTLLLKDISVGLAPGSYNCRLVIRNRSGPAYADRFVGEPLSQSVMLDNILIEPGKITSIQIGKKRKKLGLSGSELYMIR